MAPDAPLRFLPNPTSNSTKDLDRFSKGSKISSPILSGLTLILLNSDLSSSTVTPKLLAVASNRVSSAACAFFLLSIAVLTFAIRILSAAAWKL